MDKKQNYLMLNKANYNDIIEKEVNSMTDILQKVRSMGSEGGAV